jgi:hypothetical protein
MSLRTTWIIAAVAVLGVGCDKTEETPAGTSPAIEQAAATAEPAAEPPKVEPPAGARVFFIDPGDGAEVKGPLVEGKVAVKVKMGAEGITVHEAGQQIQGTGHHHLIVDGQHVAMGSIVPKDDTHLHYGKGQTEAELTLAPGEHTLTMQFADGAHMSYGDKLSATIKIKVVGEGAAQ